VLLLALSVAGLVAAGAIVWSSLRIAAAIERARADRVRDRALGLLGLFAPAVVAADRDPRSILVWQPLAGRARALFAEEFTLLDRAAGARFPFGAEQIQDMHAKWTAEWLAWERSHDTEYKLKAAAAEQDCVTSPSSLARARLEAIEREKLDRYQRRYEEYIRVAKALQALSV
jgi:hypothetical protein